MTGINVTFDGSNASVLNGSISGPGQFTKQGTGTLSVWGANDYSGGATVQVGTLEGNTTSLSAGNINNAGVLFTQNSNAAYTKVISGTGQVTKSGSAILTFNVAHSYSGGTSIPSGTLKMGLTNGLNSNGAMAISSGAIFDLNNFNQQIGSLSGAGNVTLGTAGMTVTQAVDNTHSGVISGASGSVTKQGAATLIWRDHSFIGHTRRRSY